MKQLNQCGAASGLFPASHFLNCDGLPLTPEVSARAPSSPKMAAAGEDLDEPRLSELFETCQRILEEIEVATEPSGSKMFQGKVVEGLEFLKKAAEMLTQLDLFRYGGAGGGARLRTEKEEVMLVTRGGANESGQRRP